MPTVIRPGQHNPPLLPTFVRGFKVLVLDLEFWVQTRDLKADYKAASVIFRILLVFRLRGTSRQGCAELSFPRCHFASVSINILGFIIGFRGRTGKDAQEAAFPAAVLAGQRNPVSSANGAAEAIEKCVLPRVSLCDLL